MVWPLILRKFFNSVFLKMIAEMCLPVYCIITGDFYTCVMLHGLVPILKNTVENFVLYCTLPVCALLMYFCALITVPFSVVAWS